MCGVTCLHLPAPELGRRTPSSAANTPRDLLRQPNWRVGLHSGSRRSTVALWDSQYASPERGLSVALASARPPGAGIPRPGTDHGTSQRPPGPAAAHCHDPEAVARRVGPESGRRGSGTTDLHVQAVPSGERPGQTPAPGYPRPDPPLRHYGHPESRPAEPVGDERADPRLVDRL